MSERGRRKRKRKLRVFGVLDFIGGAGMTPEQEVAHSARHLGEMLNVRTEVLGLAADFSAVPDSTDVLFFDYGGVANGYGPNVFGDRVRDCKRWAEDHPSALVRPTRGNGASGTSGAP